MGSLIWLRARRGDSVAACPVRRDDRLAAGVSSERAGGGKGLALEQQTIGLAERHRAAGPITAVQLEVDVRRAVVPYGTGRPHGAERLPTADRLPATKGAVKDDMAERDAVTTVAERDRHAAIPSLRTLGVGDGAFNRRNNLGTARAAIGQDQVERILTAALVSAAVVALDDADRSAPEERQRNALGRGGRPRGDERG
jgi:hypothetical protein